MISRNTKKLAQAGDLVKSGRLYVITGQGQSRLGKSNIRTNYKIQKRSLSNIEYSFLTSNIGPLIIDRPGVEDALKTLDKALSYDSDVSIIIKKKNEEGVNK
ncbi:hypothetical protein E4H04_09085 [Candidatus Bathyarchaeota archaeon]|nr:MAG: hypothetical protein E4H04_09085 [Candidatus Bathyarchaeota archaeon]